MRRPRVVVGVALPAPGERMVLPERAAHHLFRVLRRRAGDEIEVVDGVGASARARLEGSVRSPAAEITEHCEPGSESPLRIHLGQCLIKTDRTDWLVQKATELGVERISLLTSERSEVRLSGERAARKCAHWQAVATSAVEQSGRLRVPAITLDTLESFVQQAGTTASDCFVLDPEAATLPASGLASVGEPALLVGPEGGLAPGELALARDHGFRSWGLGARILRGETAPLAALAILQFIGGDLAHPG